MNFHSLRHKPLAKLCLGLLVFFLIALGIQVIHPRPVSAELPGYDNSSRYNNSELSTLRQRINQLESERRFLDRSRITEPSRIPSGVESEPSYNPPAIVNGEPVGRSDPMFERLATLVIELKEQVNTLETRLREVENRVK